MDKWNSIQDRQFFSNARQFYQRTERTAARPETGGNQQAAPRLPEETQRRGETQRSGQGERQIPPVPGNTREPQTPPPAQQQPAAPLPPSGQTPGAQHQPEPGRQAPPASAPENRGERNERNPGK